MTRASCIERVAAAIASIRLGHPTRVAIDGVDGAGKTRLADELVEPLERMGRKIIRALVDGVFLRRPELAASWDFGIRVGVPFGVTVSRAVSRDAAGSDQAAAIQARYERRYVPGQLLYLERCRPRDAADITFDNAEFENPELRHRPGAEGAVQP